LTWIVAYSRVSGELPLEGLPTVNGRVVVRLPQAPPGMGRAKIEFKDAGPAEYLANGKDKLVSGATLPPGSLIVTPQLPNARVAAEWQTR
jgi:hypothetical protein